MLVKEAPEYFLIIYVTCFLYITASIYFQDKCTYQWQHNEVLINPYISSDWKSLVTNWRNILMTNSFTLLPLFTHQCDSSVSSKCCAMNNEEKTLIHNKYYQNITNNLSITQNNEIHVSFLIDYVFPLHLHIIYRQVSNIRHTKSQYLKDSRTVLRLSLPNPLKPDVKSRMKM